MSTLEEVLKENDLSQLKKKLIKLGVNKPGDLAYLKIDDINKLKANPIEKAKLIELVEERKNSKDEKTASRRIHDNIAPDPALGNNLISEPSFQPVPAPRKKRNIYEISESKMQEMLKNQVISICKLLESGISQSTLGINSYKQINTFSYQYYVKYLASLDLSLSTKYQTITSMVFYCMKCHLPLNDITNSFHNRIPGVPRSNFELFHIIFQLSDPIVKVFCIDDNSFSFPIPFYYPLLCPINKSYPSPRFKICQELWFTFPRCLAIVSFGLGNAGWNPVGKSHLLDIFFDTDFTKTNTSNNAFHCQSIDVQITNNIRFDCLESKQHNTVSYFDCHSCTPMNVIKILCKYVNIRIVHVLENDFLHNREKFEKDLNHISQLSKITVVIVRDCDCTDLTITKHESYWMVRIYNITEVHQPLKSLQQADAYKFEQLSRLKLIFRKILFEKYDLVDENLVQSVMKDLKDDGHDDIVKSITTLNGILKIIEKSREKSGVKDFLVFYPIFAKYMKLFHKTKQEKDQNEIDKINAQCADLHDQLERSSMSPIIPAFLTLIKSKYSTFLLLRLSKYLQKINKIIIEESANDPKYLYSIDIMWREALLSFTHNQNMRERERNTFTYTLQTCFSKQILEGEPFELIDGDNLVFCSKDIDLLLEQYYQKQTVSYRRERRLKISTAPIVISIFGPQSSGKSTLLNFCFGCRFATSAGRCTKGVYGALFKINELINNHDTLLILDTEGLDSIRHGKSQNNSTIDFDRTMALFCLSVSQIVIINIKGEISEAIKNLLKVCAFSLNRLKVNKVALPRIYLVLNQQTDPDIRRHLDELQMLVDSMEDIFYTSNLEPVKVSSLVKICTDDLFILPSAFNSEVLNNSPLCDYDSYALKYRTTEQFVNKCSMLRNKIFDSIEERGNHEKQPYDNVSDWIQMAGLIWETCVKYQDIVMFKDLEEMAFSEKIREISHKLIDKEIYKKAQKFEDSKKEILREIDSVEKLCNPKHILTDKMIQFDETFTPCSNSCMSNFEEQVRASPVNFEVVYNQTKFNLQRLIMIFRKHYEDEIKFRLKQVLLEVNIRESMNTFQESIANQLDDYINCSQMDKEAEFEKIWKACYDSEHEDDTEIRNEIFKTVYTNFKIECNFIEERQTIVQLFRRHDFNMDGIISEMEREILFGLKNSDTSKMEERYFFILLQSYGDFTKVEPHNSRNSHVYLSPNSFVTENETRVFNIFLRKKKELKGWIPKECHPIVRSFTGDYNYHEIVWGAMSEKIQILRLISKLRSPSDPNNSCWDTLIAEVSKNALLLLEINAKLFQTTIKLLINQLYLSIQVVNHEIKYIRAKLSNKAERALSTLVFSYAFREFLNYQISRGKSDQEHRDQKKLDLRNYFYQQIANRKMLKGNWDTRNMSANDSKISSKFALDYIESIKRHVVAFIETDIKKSSEHYRDKLTLENQLLTINEKVNQEINEKNSIEITDISHFVIRFICERNILLEDSFNGNWDEIKSKITLEVNNKAKQCFVEYIGQLLDQFELLLHYFEDLPKEFRAKNCLFSDYNFQLASQSVDSIKAREAPFKAMAVYLSNYLNPNVTNEQMGLFRVIRIDEQIVVKTHSSILPRQRLGPCMSKDNFKRLQDTNIFHSDMIFNISSFISNFRDILAKNLRSYSANPDFIAQKFEELRDEFLKDALGCSMQCPSCGKFCERGIHNDGSKCQILTGHQYSSMGGKVWQDDTAKSAVTFMCDDYEDHTPVNLPGKSMKWSEFKIKCGNEWDWELPKDQKYKSLQTTNKERMQKIWTKFGRGILKYYSQHGTTITYIPYKEMRMNYASKKSYICFVIDSTGSMSVDIKKARLSVAKLVKHYQNNSTESHFRIVIYRDHCDKDIIETFPSDGNFSFRSKDVMRFLEGVTGHGGGLDGPEAMLDGLAVAASKTQWKNDNDRNNIIVHIYDMPPHGDFPDYKKHDSGSNKGYCCCCSGMCSFDWDSNVWKPIKRFNISYHGINTGRNYPGFENTMKEKLGGLCGKFTVCGREQVDEAIMEVFINIRI